MLLDAETKYTTLEKLTLAVVTATRKLGPYFENHPIKVISSYPIKAVFSKHDLFDRFLKWVVEVEGYGIQYKPTQKGYQVTSVG